MSNADSAPKSAPNSKSKYSDAELSGPALKTFFNIASAWDLNDLQQLRILRCPSLSTLKAWRLGKFDTISRRILMRISYIFGIYKALQILLPEGTAADEWIKKKNSAAIFNNRSALDVILEGDTEALLTVRQYLDFQRL